MRYRCTNCRDTGQNPDSDYLDCVKCDMAQTRSDFNAWCKEQGYPYHDAMFAAFLYGLNLAKTKKEKYHVTR